MGRVVRKSRSVSFFNLATDSLAPVRCLDNKFEILGEELWQLPESRQQR